MEKEITFDSLPAAVMKLSEKVDLIREEIPKYLSTENALAYLKKTGFPMSKSKLYKLTSYGRIPFHKSGNTLLFIPEELDKWCESDIYADDEKHINELIINKTQKMSHKNK